MITPPLIFLLDLEVGDSVDNPILINYNNINTVKQTPYSSLIYPFNNRAF
jgi:hypothetical protein